LEGSRQANAKLNSQFDIVDCDRPHLHFRSGLCISGLLMLVVALYDSFQACDWVVLIAGRITKIQNQILTTRLSRF
jgi:hypothetical protein